MEFGCKLSTYDSRDFTLKASIEQIPDTYICPLKMPVKNQKNICSCVAHATSSILEYHTQPYQELSTNFIYGIRKKLFNSEGTGMMLRDACKIVADYGDPIIEDCPGNTEVPECFEQAAATFAEQAKMTKAREYRVLKYFLCLSNSDIKHAIYKHGPVLAAIRWYHNYTVAADGTLVGEQKGSYGHHAIVIYGYTPDGFWCQNSWGAKWGKEGRFFLPNTIRINEARGFIDWNGVDELKEPHTGGIWNLIYKGINAIVNIIRKFIEK